MRRYDIRCASGHYSEILMNLSEFQDTHTCGCGEKARVVITKPAFFSVDNTDRRDYASVTGQNFSNRRELDAYLAANNAHIPGEDDSVLRGMFDQRAERMEERRMIESRGQDWSEYLQDKLNRENAKRFETLAANGVGIESLSREQAEAQGWSPTVDENDYMSETVRGTTPSGTSWAKASLPNSVEEPVFE